jgi:hypothetical protein
LWWIVWGVTAIYFIVCVCISLFYLIRSGVLALLKK